MKKIVLGLCFLFSVLAVAQKGELKATLANGVVVCGYVDDGAFLNFTGPNIKLQCANSSYMIGMLPSLKFKEDKGATKHSFVTPGLGLGITYTYKSFAVQVPLYYTGKTSVKNGEWNVGIGIGFKLSKIFRKKESSI